MRLSVSQKNEIIEIILLIQLSRNVLAPTFRL